MNKRIWILLLIVGMLLFTACGTEQSVVGTWTMRTPYIQLAGSLPTEQELGNLADYVDFETLSLVSTYTFAPDGTYEVKSEVEQYIRDCRNLWIDGINAYYADQISERNLDITVEEAWILDGLNAEELVDAEAIRTAFADLDRAGNYKTRDGKLFLSDGKEHRVDESVYTVYEVSGNSLVFLSAVGGNEHVTFPVTLIKAS